MNCVLARNDFDRFHSAPFPKDLPLAYIEAMTNKSNVICEPFAGSGTTIVACEELGRRCFAMELSENYCAVILERLSSIGLEAKRIT